MNLCILALAAVLGGPPPAVWSDLTHDVMVRPNGPEQLGVGASHIVVDSDGRVAVFAAVEGELLSLSPDGRVTARRRVRPPRATKQAAPSAVKRSRHEGVVAHADQQWHITTEAELGALHVVGRDRRGRVHVVVEELLSRSPVRVRRSLHVLSPGSRAPVLVSLPAPSPIRIEREWAMGPDGSFYLLQVSPESVQVLRWRLP